MLNLAILWHMHQPYYKDTFDDNGVLQMPWVRLHAIKDYYDMVAILEDYPEIHQTFNVVPSLFEQLEDYANGNVTDSWLELSRKRAEELTEDDKEFILQNFFSANHETMIKPYPRYYGLLTKLGRTAGREITSDVIRRYSRQDFLDLQVWYNLTWFDPIFRDDLKKYFDKSRNFSEEEKNEILDKQIEIIGKIIPKYKEMQEQGIIEISVTPYFHPILPLLCDTNSARVAVPDIALPQHRFQHPEDADHQIQTAVEYYKRILGTEPKGMWPSEGSVSPDIIPLVTKAGIHWLATDEEILRFSLDSWNDDSLFQAYRVSENDSDLNMIFRDHRLSDAIGFIYPGWDAEDASDDFIKNLENISEMLHEIDNDRDWLVAVILDGENCWEYYPNEGKDFLNALYTKLTQSEQIQSVTISEYLDKNPPKGEIKELYSGSWINHNFRVWIGHPEDNRAWDYLWETRKALEKFEAEHQAEEMAENIQKAWKEIYIAEGSDWCWWYGDDRNSNFDLEFDRLFRSHLINVYNLLNLDVPNKLYDPISGAFSEQSDKVRVSTFISPIIDGNESSFFEWRGAAHYEPFKEGSAMQKSSGIIKDFYFGYDEENIYFRLDFSEEIETDLSLKISFVQPEEKDFEFSFSGENEIGEIAVGEDIVEASLAIEEVTPEKDTDLKFLITLNRDGKEVDRYPGRSILTKFLAKEIDSLSWL